jgi:hypothetical protein
VGVIVDDDGDPALPCATCGGFSLHQAPGDGWHCSACEPPTLPGDAEAMGGWSFCVLPSDPDDPAQDGPPGALQSCLGDDPGSGHAGEGASPADTRPGASLASEDNGPPDPRTAPIGKCRRCGWVTPLSGRGMCWRCAVEGRS